MCIAMPRACSPACGSAASVSSASATSRGDAQNLSQGLAVLAHLGEPIRFAQRVHEGRRNAEKFGFGHRGVDRMRVTGS